MEDNSMKKHITLVAAFHIGFSAIGLIGSLIMFFIFSFAGSFVEDVDVAETVLHFIGTFLPTMFIMVALLGLTGGIGLLSFQRWARILAMIVSAVGCLFFPIGTAIGIYSLWVLMQDDTVKLFH
ncbi:MAG TPA: hypothetical protein VHI78_08610 [Bacteroidales bacterium]|jgi:hypothetical protein|nr:hypothetical protein [Bacteroidales bacterium]